jgi:SAM-dependent methyltransferase
VSVPDLSDPRYLDEVGWFLYHEQYERDQFGGTYDEERTSYSALLLDEVLSYTSRDVNWLARATVVSIGSGCTGDLSTWPAAVKIAVDPLLGAYQQLGLLLVDAPGTAQTIYLAVGGQDIPLVDATADLVICRNSLDHMIEPAAGLEQMQRILKHDGLLHLSVDLGGQPTPDEPVVFTSQALLDLVDQYFEARNVVSDLMPHSHDRDSRMVVVAQPRPLTRVAPQRADVLAAYEARIREELG